MEDGEFHNWNNNILLRLKVELVLMGLVSFCDKKEIQQKSFICIIGV